MNKKKFKNWKSITGDGNLGIRVVTTKKKVLKGALQYLPITPNQPPKTRVWFFSGAS